MERKTFQIMGLLILTTIENLPKKASCINRHVGYFQAVMTSGSHLMFVYIDITEQQNVGDLQAPFIKVIQSERRIFEKR